MKDTVKRILAARGFTLARSSESELVPRGNPHCADAIESLYALMREHLLPSLPELQDEQSRNLVSLAGVTPAQAIYLLDGLQRTRSLGGAVCEMGVAQGRTSRLIARAIEESQRELWLFDSFQGLPQPSARDELIDDIFGLGSMEAYAGTMRVPRDMVEHQLSEGGFPPERVHIVEGFFDETTSSRVELPSLVSFAFIDFDLYQPIKDALRYLNGVVEPGGFVAVHEYGYFSTGPEAAVDEFLEDNRQAWDLTLPHDIARGIAILERKQHAG